MTTERGEPKPWAQQPDEPGAAYARFLTYLHLGRTRTLEAAIAAWRSANPAKKREKTRAPSKASISGTWAAESSRYEWVARARAWDIEMMVDLGYDTVVDFVNTLSLLASKTLRAAASQQVRPRGLKTILQLVNLLGSFIPAETVAAIRADAEGRRVSAIGARGGAQEPEP